MINIYPDDSRYYANHGWLKTYHSFSFAEYYDPKNMNFGPLRVLNDDIVAPKRGFGMHPHKEMEIVTIVLEGELRHEDSTGETATTTFGGIQRMSAGTGIFHSEVNPSKTEEVNLLQLWFLPEQYGLKPSYEKTTYDIKKMKNNLLPVVTKNPTSKDIAHIHQDLTIYLSELESGHSIDFKQKKERRTFLFVIEGEVTINENETLKKRDSARITEEEALLLKTNSGAKFMLIDLP